MQLLDRSLKRRACDKINSTGGQLAYIDQGWDEIVPRLLDIVEPAEDLAEKLKTLEAEKEEMKSELSELEEEVKELRKSKG